MRRNGVPRVYLAAPYTARAEARVASSGEVVADQLPTGDYRSALTRMAKAIERCGATVVLPHRDISRWGACDLTPGEIATRCTEQVRTCDVLVALLATSFGTHVEVGVALGARIPVIALLPSDTETSFFASCLADSELVHTVEAEREAALPDLLTDDRFARAMRSAISKRQRSSADSTSRSPGNPSTSATRSLAT